MLKEENASDPNFDLSTKEESSSAYLLCSTSISPLPSSLSNPFNSTSSFDSPLSPFSETSSVSFSASFADEKLWICPKCSLSFDISDGFGKMLGSRHKMWAHLNQERKRNVSGGEVKEGADTKLRSLCRDENRFSESDDEVFWEENDNAKEDSGLYR